MKSIIVTGPRYSGKTRMSHKLGEHFGLEVKTFRSVRHNPHAFTMDVLRNEGEPEVIDGWPPFEYWDRHIPMHLMSDHAWKAGVLAEMRRRFVVVFCLPTRADLIAMGNMMSQVDMSMWSAKYLDWKGPRAVNRWIAPGVVVNEVRALAREDEVAR